MTQSTSPGARFRAAVAEERPLQVVGAITAYAARMAQRTGFKALYLSGGGVAANSLGMPDLGISTMEDVLTDVRRISVGSCVSSGRWTRMATSTVRSIGRSFWLSPIPTVRTLPHAC